MNAAIKLDRQSVLEAIEIHHPTFDTALAAKLRAQLSATQEMPRHAFGISLLPP
jgi:hypothetical protein